MKKKRNQGFTLLEMTIVLLVISVLFLLTVPNIQKTMEIVNRGFEKRREFFRKIIAFIDILPNSFDIAKKWNISDHRKRVKDGSITYDYFKVSRDKVEYRISKCMYVEMFDTYGIKGLCKIFCMTDEFAYAGLPKHVKFIRHSDLSDGPTCADEVIRRR